jgi:Tol biopolymer transport system component
MRNRGTGWRARQGVVMLAALMNLACVQLATSAAPSRARAPRILASSASGIAAFAQDGSDIAWITQDGRCGDRLHIRRANGRTRTVNRIACTDNPYQSELLEGELALANGRALWNVGCGFSNEETDYCLRTASFADPRVRGLGCCDMTGGLANGPTYLPLAGRGRALVYYSHWDPVFSPDSVDSGERAIRQVLGSRTRKLFNIDRPLGLSVDHGRVAAVQAELARGDGCGCSARAVWSPDGARLALLRASESDQTIGVGDLLSNQLGLASMNPDGSGLTWLKAPGQYGFDAVDWSNDGKRLVYSYASEHAVSGYEIAVANADGSGAHDIADGDNPRWSPTADSILFESPEGIWTVNADGTGLRKLAKGEQPSWSPDGQRIAFAGDIGEGLYTMRADGGGVHRIRLPGQDFINDPAWSPDGRQIAYVDDSARPGLYKVNLDGSGRRRLATPPVERAPYFAHVGAEVRWPDWSPDGRTIVYTGVRTSTYSREITYEGEIYTIAAAGGGRPRPLTFSTPNRWRTIGQIRRPGRTHIVKYGSDGVPTAVALSGPIVAVLAELGNGGKRISVFEGRNGALRRSFDVPRATGPELGLNRRWVVFRVGRTIRAIDLATNAGRILARARADPFDLSISGRRVAWAENRHRRGTVRAIMIP